MGKLKVVIEAGVEAKRPTFGELSPGDCFIDGDGDFCIVVDTNCDGDNAVVLKSDCSSSPFIYSFLREEQVTPVEAELRIGKPAAAPEAKPLTFGDLAVGDRFFHVNDRAYGLIVTPAIKTGLDTYRRGESRWSMGVNELVERV